MLDEIAKFFEENALLIWGIIIGFVFGLVLGMAIGKHLLCNLPS